MTATDAEVAAHFEARKEDYRIGERRKVRYVLVDVESLRQASWCRRERWSATTTTTSSCSRRRAGAREPHPPQDRRKDAAVVKAAAEKVLQEAKGPRRLRGTREEVLRRRVQRQARRRPRLLHARPDGAGVRRGGIQRPAGPHPGPRDDELRVPHHQGGRQEGRHGPHVRRGQGPDPRTSSSASARSVWPTPAPRRRPRRSRRRPTSTGGEGARWKVEETGFFAADEPILALGAPPQVSAEIFA